MRIAWMILIGLLVTPPASAPATAQGGIDLNHLLSGLSLGSTITKVRELPDIPQLRTDDGQYIDLGYLRRLGGKGEWVGHVGSSRKYLPLTPRELDQVLIVSGLYRLPPAPEQTGGGLIGLSAFGGPGMSNHYWWISLFLTASLTFSFKAIRRVTRGAIVAGRQISKVNYATTDGAPTADWSKAHEQIALAMEAQPQPIQPATPSVASPAGPAVASAQGFGRRSR